MDNERTISFNTLNKDEISVSSAIKKEVERLHKVPEGYNAKNWRIEVEFFDEKNYLLASYGNGKED